MKLIDLKKITAVMLSVLLLCALSLQAFAEEGEEIGNFSGDISSGSGTDESEAEENANLISLSNDVTYDPASKMFYRYVENSRFGMNIPDGAVITGTVSVNLSPSLIGVLYKNGEEQQGADLTAITAPGKYVLAVTANDNTLTERVTFTILSSPTSAVKEYIMPTDFYVVSATLNGEDASYSMTYVDMTRDGDYVINYRSPAAEVDMQLTVTIDHTPPTVTLTGLTDGKANGPVTVSDMEEGATAYLVRNSTQITYSNTIDETGTYTLTVMDEAGNESVYDFVIVTYANSSLKVLIVSAIVLVLALLGYIIYYRKHIRVS